MEEQKLKKLEKLMSEEEFTEYIHNKVDEDFKNGIIHLHTFEVIGKFKSVRRAIKRGLVSPYGEIYPKRSFNNRTNTSKRKGVHSRSTNELKKQIYEQVKQYQRRVAQ